MIQLQQNSNTNAYFRPSRQYRNVITAEMKLYKLNDNFFTNEDSLDSEIRCEEEFEKDFLKQCEESYA